MNRYQLVVPEHMHGSKLLPCLSKAYPLAPDMAFRRALKNRDIKVNGQRVADNCAVTAGQLVEWYTQWAPAEIPILYMDNRLLVIDKPNGISSDEQAGEQMTLTGLLASQLKLDMPPRMVHRLDHQTSGLMILALTAEAEDALVQAFRQGQVDKRYTCLAKGEMPRQGDTLRAWLRKDARVARVQVSDAPAPEARVIVTEYRVLSYQSDCSRLEICLHTGRTHQIRAHLAHIGHPILGDDKYGDRAFNRFMGAGRLMLASTGLTLRVEGLLADLDGRSFSIEAPF